MTNLGKTYFLESPKPIEITDAKVFIATDIHQIEVHNEWDDNIIKMYECNLVSYEKDEYIMLMAKQAQDIDKLKEELDATKVLLGVD